ncbi:hypothetical protein CF15_03095 [Pyrodictium occultum]|uniref:Uncharacterized protein n=1 Tax=Pyrodictium occultum TaxID=2309 RepID=A0A0V8RUR2_PYROC|nr:hypothetical protein [Pyrodictium occultum]KSW11804.1 hypothetical protein CF15_03095 [Pyrodictium occultum]
MGSEKDLESCIAGELGRAAKSIAVLLEAARRLTHASTLWETFEWQRAKRIIAQSIASCLCRILGCRVYMTDLHGGEPSTGLGDKDIDLIIDCPQGPNPSSLEGVAERLAAGMLRSLLGDSPYRVLGVPNIVEVHEASEFLFKKYLERGAPYVARLC